MEFRREDIFHQIAKDKDLRDEILTKISDMPEIGVEIVKPHLEEVTMGAKGLELVSVAQKVDDAMRILYRNAGQTFEQDEMVPPQFTGELKEAYLWAKDNPNDPRAAQILTRLGVK